MTNNLNWQDIENHLDTLEDAEHGYSSAHRGIVTLEGDGRIFVKIGVDDDTKQWAKKEIAVYKFLADHSFAHIPHFIAQNDDQTAFALEALELSEGWNWKSEWTSERLEVTLRVMDELAKIIPSEEEKEIFAVGSLSRDANGWKPLAESESEQAILRAKLNRAGHAHFFSQFNLQTMAEESMRYIFKTDGFVHNDVRADNCAWNPKLGLVKLIDLNWAQLGDRRIDINAMLVNVHRSGFDVTANHTGRLDIDALQWMAGFWLHASTKPLPSSSSEKTSLRDYQLESGVAALKLYEAICTNR